MAARHAEQTNHDFWQLIASVRKASWSTRITTRAIKRMLLPNLQVLGQAAGSSTPG